MTTVAKTYVMRELDLPPVRSPHVRGWRLLCWAFSLMTQLPLNSGSRQLLLQDTSNKIESTLRLRQLLHHSGTLIMQNTEPTVECVRMLGFLCKMFVAHAVEAHHGK